MKRWRSWTLAAGGVAMAGAVAAQTADHADRPAAKAAAPAPALRVCANPDNLPFSNRKGEGFENRIAELIAAELKLPIEYTWHYQRRAFLRRTLNADRCDVVMGAPVGMQRLTTTTPYYRSTYVFVTRTDRKLGIRSFDHPALRDARIGLHAVGDDGDNPPPVYSLARRGMTANIASYKLWDVDEVINPQGRVIEAVAKGEIDVAIVWGPFAGYFAKRQPVPLTITPVPPDIPELPFDYAMALGVRTGDEALKARLEAILDKRRADIRRILLRYGVPLIDQPVVATTAAVAARVPSDEPKKE